MQGFFDFVKSLGAARMAAMAAVTFALIGFFSFLMIQMTTPTMVPLFTDLSPEDSNAIIKDLERQAVTYEIRSDGAIVLVPKDKVARLRMKLAEGGLPKGGGVGYEIFDKSDALGATSFIQNINHLRALEGELARTIRGLDRVEAARVHLVLPERPLFSRDKVEATASIVLKVRGTLEPPQVRAIRHLVATAVNGMRPERVSVIDETGRLLADGAAQNTALGSGGGADERKTAYENRLREQVETIVSSVVGPGHARVQLTADFDLNRITETSDKFDPDGRVVRSSQTREEQSSSSEGKEGGQVSVSGQLPGTNANPDAAATPKDQSKKTEEIVNYEISRTTKTETIEAGRVNRISAAVLVDGRYTKDAKGEMVYQPRPKEEIDRIAALVRSAIGFDAKRGDQVEVVNLRFAETTPVPLTEPTGWMKYLQFTKDDIMGAAEKGVMALLGLIVLLMVVRPLVRRIVTPEHASLAGAAGIAGVSGAIGGAGAGVEIGPDGKPLTPGGGSITNTSGANISIIGGEESVAISNRTSTMIDVAQVQGQVHAQSVQKVGELAQRNPHEAVAVIRSWLHGRGRLMPSAYAKKEGGANESDVREDIGGLMAELAKRPQLNTPTRKLTGPERAAVLMLALGDQYGGSIFSLLDDDELREISIVMSSLGTVDAEQVEQLLLEFVGRLSASGALLGNYDATERLLAQFLPKERISGIMDEIRGPAGRNMWEKLANVQEEVLANYLKNEYPQTVAVVLSKLRPEHAARVLSILPEDFSLDCVTRMLKMEAVQKEVIERVEQTLRTEFMSNLSQTRRRDAHEVMAEIFNNFDRQTETRFLTSLEEENRDAAERIKALMFTFDDLIKLDAGSAQTLMRNIDKDKLAVALKGANEAVRTFFFGNMSSRAAKMLVDDMQAMGAVRLRDVDEAQTLLVNIAKDLAAKGEILIAKSRGDDELIY